MSLVLPAVAAVLAATAYAGFAQSVAVSKAQRRVSQLEAALEVEQTQRAAERAARIRAQKELKEARLGNAPGEQAFPFVPIGVLRTCYTTRNGTPRQPLLVPLARARLRLNTGPLGVPPACLEGLEQFSHCWVLYVFHANTDLQRLWQGDRRSMKAKVKVPRLNGEKVGVFATRSPHRPVPIGLSIAKVDRIDGDTLYLSGVDIVDGSPVLDIKPYLPYSDAMPSAGVPAWVLAQGDDDPLNLREVVIEATAMADLTSAWRQTASQSLYESVEAYASLLQQVLSRDIRSLRQRTKGPKRSVLDEGSGDDNDVGDGNNAETVYYLVLEHIRIAYTVSGAGGVTTVIGAQVADESMKHNEEWRV